MRLGQSSNNPYDVELHVQLPLAFNVFRSNDCCTWGLLAGWKGISGLHPDALSMYELRIRHNLSQRVRGDCGWHLSFFGGARVVQQKLSAYSHREFNRDPYTDIEYIWNRMGKGLHLFHDGILDAVPHGAIELPRTASPCWLDVARCPFELGVRHDPLIGS